MVRVIGIAGSPRSGGNTETLLDRFLTGARSAGAEVNKRVAPDLDMGPCTACDGCWVDGHCIISDDYQTVCEELIAADVIVLASPLYFWNVPSQVKTVIDRSQCMWARRFVVKEPLTPSTSGHARRRGVFICVGGDHVRHFEGVVRTIKSFFRVFDIDYWGELLYHGVDAKNKIEEHPLALQEAYDMGFRAVSEPWDEL
jgi:multimeric flavodoxin WrbA